MTVGVASVIILGIQFGLIPYEDGPWVLVLVFGAVALGMLAEALISGFCGGFERVDLFGSKNVYGDPRPTWKTIVTYTLGIFGVAVLLGAANMLTGGILIRGLTGEILIYESLSISGIFFIVAWLTMAVILWIRAVTS